MAYYGETPTYRSLIGFVNPRFINQLQIWLTIPILYLTLVNARRKARKRYWLSLTVLSLHVAIAIALDARGYTLSIATALIIWLIIDKKQRSALFLEVLKAVLLGIAIKALFLAPVPEWFFSNPQNSASIIPELRTDSSLRLEHWSMLLKMASFWGHGGDAYVCNAYYLIARPHNSLLLVLFNWGVPSSLIYCLLLFLLLKNTVFTTHKGIRLMGLTLLSGFGHSFISGTLDSPLSQLLAVLCLSNFWALYNRHNSKNNNINLPSIKNSLITSLAIISLVVFLTVSYLLYDRVIHNHYRDLGAHPLLERPQFWLGNNCHDSIPYLQLKRQP
jgi:hypothetical protein